jgi:hypothetical protein
MANRGDYTESGRVAQRRLRNNARRGPPGRASPSLRPRVLPSRPGGDRARGAFGPRSSRGHADRRGKVDRLPAAGHAPPGNHARRLSSHLVDEGPGRRALAQRDPGGGAPLPPQPGGPPRGGGRDAGGTAPAALRRAGAVRLRVVPAAARDGAVVPLRGRRGALRLGVGPRLPPRLPAPRRSGGPLPPERRRPRAAAGPGVHGYGDARGARRHREPARPAESGDVRRGIRPAESVPGRPEGLRRDREAGLPAGSRPRPPVPGLRGDAQERRARGRDHRRRRASTPARITPAWPSRIGPASRTASRTARCRSSAPRTRSAWGSTGPTSSRWCTSRSPARSRPTTRRSAGEAGTAAAPTRRCSGTTSTCARASS